MVEPDAVAESRGAYTLTEITAAERLRLPDQVQNASPRKRGALGRPGDPGLSAELSMRHHQVLALRATGLPLKAIAIELGVSDSTVCGLLVTAKRSLGLDRWQDCAPNVGPCERAARSVEFASACRRLTRSEAEVVRLAIAGFSNVDIARRRGRAFNTIKNQMAGAFRKMGIGSRAELFARYGGGIAPEDGTIAPRSPTERPASAA